MKRVRKVVPVFWYPLFFNWFVAAVVKNLSVREREREDRQRDADLVDKPDKSV